MHTQDMTCEVCGNIEFVSGSPLDGDMVQCEGISGYAHIFCFKHLAETPKDIARKLLQEAHRSENLSDEEFSLLCRNIETGTLLEAIETLGEVRDEHYLDAAESIFQNLPHEIPWECCPVCTLRRIHEDSLFKLAQVLLNKTEDDLRKEAERRYDNLKELHDEWKFRTNQEM